MQPRYVQIPALNQVNHATPTQQQALLRSLPQLIDGQPTYLLAFLIEAQTAPTFTTKPTRVGQNVGALKQVSFFDGYRNVYTALTGMDIRVLERLQNRGHVMLPDADTNASSTTTYYVRRALCVADPRFETDDMAIPVAQLAAKNGRLDITPGALADLSADTTAATTNLNIVAVLGTKRELVAPVEQECFTQTFATSPAVIGGEAVYVDIAFSNSTSYDAIAAGKFGTVTFATGRENTIEAIPAPLLSALHWLCGQAGQVVEAQGEPRAAGDAYARTFQANAAGSAAAFGTTTADLQVLLSASSWGPSIEAHITQLPYVPAEARIIMPSVTGTPLGFFHRIIRSDASMRLARGVTNAQQLGVAAPTGVRIKTKSGAQYKGPRPEFMPMKFLWPNQ